MATGLKGDDAALRRMVVQSMARRVAKQRLDGAAAGQGLKAPRSVRATFTPPEPDSMLMPAVPGARPLSKRLAPRAAMRP